MRSRITRLSALFILCLLTALTFATGVGAAPVANQSLALSGTTFSLSTATPSIPLSGSFNWTVTMRPARSVKSAQIRFEVRRPSGALVYQRTRYLNDLAQTTTASSKATKPTKEKTVYEENFTRELNGLSLTPGIYEIGAQVTVSGDTERETATLNSEQYIYDSTVQATKWLCAVHFTSMPLRNEKGVFIVDPSKGTPEAQRQALSRIANLAVAQPSKPILLYLPPLLLEDFTAASKGYTLKTPGALTTQKVGPTSTTAQLYATTLNDLTRALSQGSLRLGIVGFSDPDLAKLSTAKLESDIAEQYNRSLSTLAPLIKQAKESVETSITAPLGVSLTQSTLRELETINMKGVFVSDTMLRPSASVGHLSNTMTGYVVNSSLSSQLTSQETTSVSDAFFERMLKESDDDFTIVTNSLVSTEAQAQKVASSLETLFAQPWLTVADAHAVANGRTLKPLVFKSPKTTIYTHAPDIVKARQASKGMLAAFGENVAAIDVRENSLIAEFGAPLSEAQESFGNDQRAAYAKEALNTASSVFKKISVKASSVTLSGRKGKVPISIKNETGFDTNVTLDYRPTHGLNLEGEHQILFTLPQRETFLEPNVSMQNATHGKLAVTISAGGYPICEKTVNISASYIDTIVIVVIVVVIGIALLLFIYRRVSTSDMEVNLFTGEDEEDASIRAEYNPTDPDSE